MEKPKLANVFQTVGLPKYTYVKPVHFGEVRSDIEQPGKHLLIEGPSGIGKTCVVYKVFEELGWEAGTHYFLKSCRDADAELVISKFLDDALADQRTIPIFVADDFHILPDTFRAEVGAKLKQLSDRVFEVDSSPKVILIGIPAAGSSVMTNAKDLGPRLGSYRIKRASDSEIDKLISEGEEELNVLIESRETILSESGGNFWLAQSICNKVCALSGVHERCDEVKVIDFDLPYIRERLLSDFSQRFMSTATAFAKGRKWRPGGNKPYLEVLLAMCRIPELVIPFDTILSLVPERRRPGIKGVRSRIRDVIFDETRGIDLRRQLAFEESYFSIEDPLFRYFLSNVDEDELYRELGIAKDSLDGARQFTYDFGFSFAGEVRPIVEVVNGLLKSEDALCFYDFDQQAFLLAEDLEKALARIYSESCRFYLVFIEKNYLDKTWTRYEKDILTRPGRKSHIIPVILEKDSIGTTVGISSTTGLIDLSSIWENFKNGSPISSSVDEIKLRLVDPLIEKLGTPFQEV